MAQVVAKAMIVKRRSLSDDRLRTIVAADFRSSVLKNFYRQHYHSRAKILALVCAAALPALSPSRLH